MTISEVYHELIEEGKTKNKAAEICLGVMTSGLIDATDEETYERLKQEFINKQEGING